MAKFRVTLRYTTTTDTYVEAESEEEAERIARDQDDDGPLDATADDAECVEMSEAMIEEEGLNDEPFIWKKARIVSDGQTLNRVHIPTR